MEINCPAITTLSECVGPMVGYVLQYQLLDASGIRFGEVSDNNLRTSAGNNSDRGKKEPVIDFDTGYVRKEDEVISTAN